jgi:mitochondrial fission protein ELM1
MPQQSDTEPLRCLILSDGRRGIENQALGLAERCADLRGLRLQTHHIEHSAAISALPPKAQLRLAKNDLPDCDIAIGCGRQAIAALIYLKRTRPHVFTVYIQDPRLDPTAFDLVIAPEHDDIRGANVETMIGSPNRVSEAKIIGETLSFAEGLSKLPMPRTAIMIGGASKTHKLDKASHAAHLQAAKNLRAAGQSVLITASRRTPDFAVLAWKGFASDHDCVWFHDGEGPNPYFAFLGGAEIILVTEDSTNMLTEACVTGKPVYRLPMAGKAGKAGKFQALYDALQTRCHVTRYDGQVDGTEYPPLDETARMAQRVWERFDAADMRDV